MAELLDPQFFCQICSSKAPPNKRHLCHYDVICCVGCRAFFRRIVQTNGTSNLLSNSLCQKAVERGFLCDLSLQGTCEI